MTHAHTQRRHLQGQATGRKWNITRGFGVTTATYAVEGLTCGSCIAEVMERVRLLPGVIGLSVDLVTGGPSPLIVTSGYAMAADEVRQAVEHAGFDLTDEGCSSASKVLQPETTRHVPNTRDRMKSFAGSVGS